MTEPKKKPGAVPLKRTAKQQAAIARRSEKAKEEAALEAAETARKQAAARLAQIVNLHIAGFSLAEIGAQIGATAAEVDKMLTNDAARYVRTQPALRTYVRNYISGKYNHLLEAVWTEATDRGHPQKLENQDRALRILDRMARLHGAEAPTQAEVKVETQPEAVEAMVKLLAAQTGQAYDDTVFDVVDADVISDVVEQGDAALEVSGNAVEQDQEGDEPL